MRRSGRRLRYPRRRNLLRPRKAATVPDRTGGTQPFRGTEAETDYRKGAREKTGDPYPGRQRVGAGFCDRRGAQEGDPGNEGESPRYSLFLREPHPSSMRIRSLSLDDGEMAGIGTHGRTSEDLSRLSGDLLLTVPERGGGIQ